ncbi:hypothetical protein V2J09_019144 [Rumex salicifolius]
MEAPAMEETKQLEEAKLTSAAAFVEGGIQEACDDACSICLDDFCESNPSTVTGCKHEFHLQCVLEWCQRSSQCPMCWQPISLKDPTGQELLDGVVQERNLRLTPPPRNSAIFHHPTLGDFEIQHLPVGVNDAELEERIIQHLAAAAAMGRARHFSRREGHRNRTSNQNRPHFLVFSAQRDGHVGSASYASPERGEDEPNTAMLGATPSSPPGSGEQSVHTTSPNQSSRAYLISASGMNQHGTPPYSRSSPSQASPSSQDRAGPSDLQSFSEALKSRLNAVSMRYKESISKSTRGWKERWFTRNSPVGDLASHDNREVSSGIASVSRLMERLETGDRARSTLDVTASSSEVNSAPISNERQTMETLIHSSDNNTSEAGWSGGNHLSETRLETPSAAPSGATHTMKELLDADDPSSVIGLV